MACSLPSRRFLSALVLLPAATLGACGQAIGSASAASPAPTAHVAAAVPAQAAPPIQKALFNPAVAGSQGGITSLAPLVDAVNGAVVAGVNRGSPGERAGLREEDVITYVNGKPVDSAGGLTRAVALLQPDSRVKVDLLRGGKAQSLDVTLGTRPAQNGEQEVLPRNASASAPRRLGVQLSDTRDGGAQVVAVEPGSPAERGGLVPGMVLVQVGDQKIASASDAAQALTAAKPGAALLLRVRMPGSESTLLRAVEVPER